MIFIHTVSLAQLIISIPLFFILAFGIGFILNMLLKSTWLPLYTYLILASYSLYNLQQYYIVDIIGITSGLLGVILTGIVIRSLRRQGYRMF